MHFADNVAIYLDPGVATSRFVMADPESGHGIVSAKTQESG
ncbi:MAG: hypothetical protein DHS20C11_38360 [Lysobacteraceae bacterium]|nr:MAG: hypothetical protein DHS20C11_38360 [Xanthomonadaceae bacterium]